MKREELVINAVKLAKNQGVLFKDNSPIFRPKNNPQSYEVSILINTTKNSAGHAQLSESLFFLDNFNENSLANRFIRIFNELNIEKQAEEIGE